MRHRELKQKAASFFVEDNLRLKNERDALREAIEAAITGQPWVRCLLTEEPGIVGCGTGALECLGCRLRRFTSKEPQ